MQDQHKVARDIKERRKEKKRSIKVGSKGEKYAMGTGRLHLVNFVFWRHCRPYFLEKDNTSLYIGLASVALVCRATIAVLITKRKNVQRSGLFN